MDFHLEEVTQELGKVSSCFCLAKWLQVTIDLEHGTNHSCHHVKRHSISLKELIQDPSALHNTGFKKGMRNKMLIGERPKECGYCWNIEDAPGKNYSDRIIKSGADWAYDKLQEIRNTLWNAPVNPTYLEVMFGNECNFSCAYCMADVSSAIEYEMEKFGPLPTLRPGNRGLDRSLRRFPPEHNPYIKAFWEWWPDLVKDLRVFRITGGEPLLNKNTFKAIDFVLEHPMPSLTLAINSNLGIPRNRFEIFLEKIQNIVNHQKVNKFQLFTSADTHGEQAEYLRNGLSYSRIMEYTEEFLQRIPQSELIFMVTFNVLSFPRFQLFLQDILQLKKRHGQRVVIDISYLQNPHYLAPQLLESNLQKASLNACLDFMEKNMATDGHHGGFNHYELEKLMRIYNLLQKQLTSSEELLMKKDFFLFINEYDRRKSTNFLKVFPEMESFYEECAQITL